MRALLSRLRRPALPVAGLLVLSAAVAGCDVLSDPAADSRVRQTGASASACSCVSSRVKQVLSPEEWQVVVLRSKGDNDAAEIAMAKLGTGGQFGFVGHLANAIGIAGRQCKVAGL